MKDSVDYMKHAEPLIYIVILNWNGWGDTIECLESVFRNDYPNFRVIVCDNNSQDSSLEHIVKWAEGTLDNYVQKGSPLCSLSFPPVHKPISYVEYEINLSDNIDAFDKAYATPLTLIQTGINLGFAGGTNVGLKYALSCKDCEYVWILNNDTVVDRSSLMELYRTFITRSDMGICGSCLHYYHEPSRIQAYGGGYYNRWLGTTSNETKSRNITSRNYFVTGASMFTSRHFLKSVGLMGEDYFIYYEEIDWMLRSVNKYLFGYSIASIVYHKEGSSIKAGNRSIKSKSILSDYFSVRNRLLIIYKYDRHKMPFAFFTFIAVLFNRVKRKQYTRIWFIVKLFFTFKRNLSYHFEVLSKCDRTWQMKSKDQKY